MSAYSNMNMNTKNIIPSIHKEMRTHSKMNYETNTVKELRNIARQRGMTGYSKLRKADLIAFVSSRPTQCAAIERESNPQEALVPDIKISTPPPTPFFTIAKFNKIYATTKSAINKAADTTKSAYTTTKS